MAVFDMTEERFLSDVYDVWMFGVDPVKIELMTTVKGLDFAETFTVAQVYLVDDIPILFLHINSW